MDLAAALVWALGVRDAPEAAKSSLVPEALKQLLETPDKALLKPARLRPLPW